MRALAAMGMNIALRRAGAATCRIRLIHGCNLGTAIMDFIWDTYQGHPRVLRLAKGPNRGITELVLREY